jgi:hypothetical protein
MVTPAATVMLKAAVALFEAESVTCAVKLVVAADPLGVPLIAPEVESERPAGSVEPLASAQVE